jgi:hypothetical protein
MFSREVKIGAEMLFFLSRWNLESSWNSCPNIAYNFDEHPRRRKKVSLGKL